MLLVYMLFFLSLLTSQNMFLYLFGQCETCCDVSWLVCPETTAEFANDMAHTSEVHVLHYILQSSGPYPLQPFIPQNNELMLQAKMNAQSPRTLLLSAFWLDPGLQFSGKLVTVLQMNVLEGIASFF